MPTRSHLIRHNKVLIDLTQDVFAHGFLYVGMSRVRRYDNMCFFVNTEAQYFRETASEELNKSIGVNNIVYKEVIRALEDH